MTITISAELIPLLRDGLYFDLHGHLDEMASAIEPRGREDICEVVSRSVERANGAFALFDVVGWVAPAQERAVPRHCFVNHPDANRSAERKPLVLRSAAHAGLMVPAWLITNDVPDGVDPV